MFLVQNQKTLVLIRPYSTNLQFFHFFSLIFFYAKKMVTPKIACVALPKIFRLVQLLNTSKFFRKPMMNVPTMNLHAGYFDSCLTKEKMFPPNQFAVCHGGHDSLSTTNTLCCKQQDFCNLYLRTQTFSFYFISIFS